MPALVFNKCCGCIELKSGCFIIGYFNLVLTIILTIVSLLAVIGGGVVSTIEGDKQRQEVGLVVMIGGSILLIFLIILLAFVITLLVGLHKNKPGHVKAYLIYSVVFLIIYTLQFITGLFGDEVFAGVVVQQIATIILNIYFMLVIRSQYYHMKDPSRGPAIYSA